MKRIFFNLLPAIFFWLGSCCIACAQATSDQITKDNQIIQDDSSSTGTFQAVTVEASATSSVTLQFPQSQAGKPVIVQSPDGGTLSGIDPNSAAIGQDGSLSATFQVADQPGIYRVMVIDPNAGADSPYIIGMVQFVVPNPPQ
jgi:hypothetical protein